MSGGFFRGTSADQDTRFSNKRTKLLRSQKFHPELEHLVDMTRVKMDVMKPWIATRVTELLGFEDEVLINFIYGLLEGKEVNGKDVQISLTGFMEKNTGKFMKELWTLLLSAQNNASGVPQQFLDAKEEETKKKKAEIERAADEIRKKWDKEMMELEQEKLKKMDGGDDNKAANGDRELNSERFVSKLSNDNLDDKKDNGKREGMRGRHRVSRSPLPADRSPSSLRGSRSRSISRSRSNSRSYSNGQRRSRSISKSPGKRRRSLTPRRRYSPRDSRSPLRRRSSYYRRRSISPRRRRNYSPYQRRSPVHRRSVTPVRRKRSPSPMRRRSPPLRRRRSPSPLRRRSPPLRRRSPPPHRRSSPPIRRRSPSPKSQSSRSPSSTQHKSVSPIGRRSPSNLRRRSPSPTRRRPHSPVKRRPRSPVHQRSHSPVRLRSPSPLVRQQRRSRLIPRQESPLATRRSPMSGHKRSILPLTKASDGSSSPSPICRSSLSPVRSSPVIRRTPSQSRDRMRRSSSPDDSPVRQVKDQVMRDILDSPRIKRKQHHDSSDTSKDRLGERKSLKSTSISDSMNVDKKNWGYYERVGSPTRVRGRADASEPRNKDQERLREKSSSGKRPHSEISEQQMSLPLNKSSLQEKERQKSPPVDIKQPAKSEACGELKKPDLVSKSVVGKGGNEQHGGTSDSVSEGSDKDTSKHKEKKRRKRSGRHEIDSESESSGSDAAEDRKEVKRRKKEERKLRKEERRRRREERRRRKDERRAEKLLKTRRMDSSDSSPPAADNEKRSHSDTGGGEGAEKDEKKLEIELRMKAIESFKAKKSVNQ